MMRNKYRNKKVKLPDGTVFDSQHEYERWRELCLLQRAGVIHDLLRQVKFELIPAQYESYERYSEKTGKQLKDGVRCIEQAVSYIADFVYWEKDQMVVEDAKGVKTEGYIIKRKLMRLQHGVSIREV